MMPRDNFLKEAIADAKTVRDMAIVSARAQLEEAFKPQLASMLSTRLRNEAGINEDNDGTSAIGSGLTVDNPAPKQPSAQASNSSNIKNPGQEFDTFGDNKQAKPIKEDFEEDEIDDVDGLGDDEIDVHATVPPTGAPGAVTGAAQAMGAADGAPELGNEFGGGEMEGGPDELDLDAIIRELELDIDGAGDGVEEPNFEDPAMGAKPQTDPTMEAFDDPMAGMKVRGPLDGALKEDAEGVFSNGKSPSDCEGVPGGKKVNPGQAVRGTSAETMKEGEELDLDEILREMEAEEAPDVESRHIATENVELKRNLREHRDVIRYLRGKLNEVNMLNAKLLFTNKLFKNFDLKVEQKMRIVETFDRASTVREVKLVYTTLAEGLNGKMNAQRKSNKTLTEGFASKAVSGTSPKSKTILAEGDELRARFMKLARINPNN